jgi:methyl-accepting chemotaxis protein
LRLGAALEQIIQRVGGAKAQAGEISAQAEAQAHNLQEVSGEIQKMDSSTQQNAAMVEQSNAASRALSAESQRLTAIVSRFQLERRSSFRTPKNGPSPVQSGTGAAYKVANVR